MCEAQNTWNFLQVGEIAPRPFVLLGQLWEDVMARFYGQGEYIREENLNLYRIAATPEEAVEMVVKWNHR